MVTYQPPRSRRLFPGDIHGHSFSCATSCPSAVCPQRVAVAAGHCQRLCHSSTLAAVLSRGSFPPGKQLSRQEVAVRALGWALGGLGPAPAQCAGWKRRQGQEQPGGGCALGARLGLGFAWLPEQAVVEAPACAAATRELLLSRARCRCSV